MATYYAKEFVGVRDGSVVPPNMADARIVDSKKRCTRASLDNSRAYASGDLIYIGRLPLGAIAKTFSIDSDTSFGATTVSIGTLANPTKYVNAKTMTNTDVPTAIGPRASAAVQDPLTAVEELYATLGAGGIAQGVNACFNTEFTISA